MELERENLLKARAFLEKQGFKVVFIALYGAQNYNLKREKSDYDYKAAVVPRLSDVARNNKPFSDTLDASEIFDGQIDVKDIRLMVDQWKKSSSNFMELLFSDWVWVNPEFEEVQWFIDNRDAISHANELGAIKAMFGQLAEKHHALTHPYPVQIEEINEVGFAGKQLSHEMRLADMLEHFHELSYKELLNPSVVEFPEHADLQAERAERFELIKKVKDRKAGLSLEVAVEWGQQFEDVARQLVDSMVAADNLEFNQVILNKMDDKKFMIVEKALRMEALNDAS